MVSLPGMLRATKIYINEQEAEESSRKQESRLKCVCVCFRLTVSILAAQKVVNIILLLFRSRRGTTTLLSKWSCDHTATSFWSDKLLDLTGWPAWMNERYRLFLFTL